MGGGGGRMVVSQGSVQSVAGLPFMPLTVQRASHSPQLFSPWNHVAPLMVMLIKGKIIPFHRFPVPFG